MGNKHLYAILATVVLITTAGCGKKDHEEYKIFSYDGIKYGYVDKMGKVVIPPKYDKVGTFDSNGLAPVKLYGKEGYINTKGEWQGGSEPTYPDPEIPYNSHTTTTIEMENPPYYNRTNSVVSEYVRGASGRKRYIEIREDPSPEKMQQYRDHPEFFLKPPGTATFWVEESKWSDPDFRLQYCRLVGVEKMIPTGNVKDY